MEDIKDSDGEFEDPNLLSGFNPDFTKTHWSRVDLPQDIKRVCFKRGKPPTEIVLEVENGESYRITAEGEVKKI